MMICLFNTAAIKNVSRLLYTGCNGGLSTGQVGKGKRRGGGGGERERKGNGAGKRRGWGGRGRR